MDRIDLLNGPLALPNRAVVARISSSKGKLAWVDVQFYSCYTEALTKIQALKKKHPSFNYILIEISERGLEAY